MKCGPTPEDTFNNLFKAIAYSGHANILLSITGHENNVAQMKPDKCLSSTSHCTPFNRQVSFCSFIKGITPKMWMLCFVLINSVLLNLFRTAASSHSCFSFV